MYHAVTQVTSGVDIFNGDEMLVFLIKTYFLPIIPQNATIISMQLVS